MLRIRLHGRGGQGIRTAGQILGSALFAEGFEVQDAPRYGAERRGAPIVAYVRAARAPINERGTIANPDLVVVADASLFQVPTAAVLQGMDGRAALLIASAEDADLWRARLALGGPIFNFDPGGDAVHSATALTGAAARMLGVVKRERLQAALCEELRGLDALTVQASLLRALGAYDAFGAHAGTVVAAAAASARGYTAPQWIDMPLDPVSVAAPDLRATANSVQVKTGAWRTRRPLIDYVHCHRCSWICSTLCPDGAIPVAADRTPRIDYDHCKGCMVCVSVCPAHAISVVPEPGGEFPAIAAGESGVAA
jgi:pyruvate ferredoxin oxidoreductase gamma subunit